MTLEKIKDFILTLNEEVKYHDSVLEHKKNLETSLWGLEEQAKFPENSSSEDQNEIIEGITKCQQKIITCSKLLSAHEIKLFEFISNFRDGSEKSSCTHSCGGEF